MLRNKELIITLFALLAFFESTAQNYFNVDIKRGCAPLTVTLTFTEPIDNHSVIYDFINLPSMATTNLVRTYTTPGMYVIRLGGQSFSLGFYKPDLDYDTVYVLDPAKAVDFEFELCTSNQVRVVISDTVYNTFQLNYGDGTVLSGLSKGTYLHTYASSATQTITVTGAYTECPGSSTSKTVTPITTLLAPDVIDISALTQSTSSTATLRYNPMLDRHYSIQQRINAGGFVAIDTIRATAAGITALSIPNLNTSANTYTYVIRNIDLCGSTPSAASVALHTGIVTPTALNGQNRVAWQSMGLFSSLNLFKDGTSISAPTAFPFFDTNVICPNNYCYKVEGTYSTISSTTGLPHKSYSGSACVNAVLVQTLPAITINSGYEGDQVAVRWETPAITGSSLSSYTLNLIGGSSGTVTQSSNSFSEAPAGHCYSVSYSDNCGNTSTTSTTTCPMQLSLNKVDDVVFATWTAYAGYFKTGFSHYEVEVLDGNGNIIGSSNVGATLNYQETPNANYALFRYRIKAVSNGAETMVSYSNTEEIDLSPQLFMPNTFTPNGDGVNDIFVPKGKYYRNFKLTVFNKWGEVIHVSEDPLTGWDGTYRNEPVSLDTYSYHVQAESNSGEKFSKRGVVAVLR